MGLLSTKVEVNLSSKNVSYYESKGYFIPRYRSHGNVMRVKKGTKIIVNVKDLFPTGGTYVDVKCDNCKKIYKQTYGNYIKYNHNGKVYCNKCANSVLCSGENNANWKFDKTEEERNNQRCYPEYTEFIKKVLLRDNYICQCCGKRDKRYNVHHLDGYDWCKEKRTDETNGITLCKNCHRNFHSIYGKGNNTKQQFEEWIGYTINLLSCNENLQTSRKVYCFEENKIYDGAIEYAIEHNINNSLVYNVCNRNGSSRSIKGKHLIWYDIYMSNTEEENNDYYQSLFVNKLEKRVICLNTKQEFLNSKKAAEWANTTVYIIKNCIRGKANRAGTDPNTNEPLTWAYTENYNNMSNKEIESKIQFSKFYCSNLSNRIICLNTLEVFNSQKEASIWCGLKNYCAIGNSIRKGCPAGKDPDTKEKLHWMYYEDYLKLNSDINKE